MPKIARNETHNATPRPERRLTGRRTAALAAAALAVTLTAACGPEIGGTMGTGKYSVGDTYLVLRDANGQVLMTDTSSDGRLENNRKGWSKTTFAQATLAGLATNSIKPLGDRQVNTICKEDSKDQCTVGTVLTVTGSTNQWYTWHDTKPGAKVHDGGNYYQYACMLDESEVAALDSSDTKWNEGRVAKAKLQADGCELGSHMQAITFVYPQSAEDWATWSDISYEFGQSTGATSEAYEDTYNFLPQTSGYQAGKVAVLEWIDPNPNSN